MFLWGFCVLMLTGCDISDIYNPNAGTRLSYIKLKTLNNKENITVDIVALTNNALSQEFEKLSSQNYFEQIGVMHALNKDKLKIWRLNQLPNKEYSYKLNWQKCPLNRTQVFIFADYRNQKNNKQKINKSTITISLQLGQNKIDKLQEIPIATTHPNFISITASEDITSTKILN